MTSYYKASYQNIYNKFQSFFYIFWQSTHHNRFNITAKQIAVTKKLNDLNQKLSLLDRYHESLIENIAMFKDDKKKRLENWHKLAKVYNI